MKDKKSIPSEEEIYSFEVFLAHLEAAEPPEKSWLHSQRKKPSNLWSMAKADRDEAFRKLENSYRGPGLKMILRAGLPVDWENDLRFCQNVTESMLRDLLHHGTWPAPAYAGRIGVLLRRAKRKDLSDRFDEIWTKFTI